MATILVVDDSDTLRTQLRKDLEGKGHKVLEAADGAIGLETLSKSGGVDLILCDVNMPNMDGLSMCHRVQQQAEFKGIPIFMLTTEANADLKARAKEFGVRAWITKPYMADKLLAAIEKILKV